MLTARLVVRDLETYKRSVTCYIYIYIDIYTGCTQKNGAVSKINKKFISRLT